MFNNDKKLLSTKKISDLTDNNNNSNTDIDIDIDIDNKNKIFIMGIPFDGTVSYRPGSRFAPAAIRNEWYGIETYSPYQDRDVEELDIFDLGDVEIPLGDTVNSLKAIEIKASEVIKSDGRLISIGGEHLVTFPIIKALKQKYPDLCIIHIDAHADLREDYLGVELSHATVMRRCYELLGDERIFQFGIRSGTKEEFEFASTGKVFMNKFYLEHFESFRHLLVGKPIYLSIDMDVLDPSVFAGTGTPEPGGVTFLALLNFIDSLKGLNYVGADLVELAPHYDTSGVSTAVACKLLREVLVTLF